MESIGIPVEFAGSFEEDECPIYPQNWKTLELFSACGTQWRVGMGGATGLDYGAVAVVAQATRIKLTAARLGGVRVMEAEALRLMAERSR